MPIRVIAADSGVDEGARLLRAGELVAFPTETVYGLGANALDPIAVARIFEAKHRPTFDPLIAHISERAMLSVVAGDISAQASALMDAFWPGPLTLIVRRGAAVPYVVTSGLETVGVRMPSNPIAHDLIAKAGVPIAAPSANRFGQLSPTTAQHVVGSLGDAIGLVLDGGHTEFGIESTIMDVSGDIPTVLRFGAVAVEDIEGVVGNVRVQTETSPMPMAPGQLDSHYAPHTRLVLDAVPKASRDVSVLVLQNPPVNAEEFGAVEVLSATGDLREAASRLFDALHRLDSAGGSIIYAERVPDVGLGRAINDRLQRASR